MTRKNGSRKICNKVENACFAYGECALSWLSSQCCLSRVIEGGEEGREGSGGERGRRGKDGEDGLRRG